nr:hypothetical protein [Pseudoxanthomonas sp.]
MRTLTMKELQIVSGGQNGGDIPPNVQKELEDAYRTARSQGLTHAEAMDACRLLGAGVEWATGRSAPGISDAIDATCSNAADKWTSLLDKSVSKICEQLDGGTWDSESRTCIR